MKTMTSACAENISIELQFAVAAISRAVILGRGSAIAPDLARLLEAASECLLSVEPDTCPGSTSKRKQLLAAATFDLAENAASSIGSRQVDG